MVSLLLNYEEGIVTMGGIVQFSPMLQNTQVWDTHQGYSLWSPLDVELMLTAVKCVGLRQVCSLDLQTRCLLQICVRIG